MIGKIMMAKTSAAVFVGLQNLSLPIFGGTLIPYGSPLIIVPGTTDADGALDLPFNIAGSSMVTLYLQALVLDLAQPQLVGFSNGLEVRIL